MEDALELGSPPFFLFHHWCRKTVELGVMEMTMPTFVFAGGRNLEPLFEEWHVNGRPPATAALIAKLVPVYTELFGASQIGVSVPFGGASAGVLLVVVDETSVAVEQAHVAIDNDHLELGLWSPTAPAALPVADWQRQLAENAGYERFAKWRCRGCSSVCPGEATEVPSPCDFCGSTEIESVSLSTPLAPPRPPHDRNPFLERVLGIIEAGDLGFD